MKLKATNWDFNYKLYEIPSTHSKIAGVVKEIELNDDLTIKSVRVVSDQGIALVLKPSEIAKAKPVEVKNFFYYLPNPIAVRVKTKSNPHEAYVGRLFAIQYEDNYPIELTVLRTRSGMKEIVVSDVESIEPLDTKFNKLERLALEEHALSKRPSLL